MNRILRTLAIMFLGIAILSLSFSGASAQPVRCVETGWTDFDNVLSATFDLLEQGGILLRVGEAAPFQNEWDDVSGQWSDVEVPPGGEAVAFTGEQLGRVMAESSLLIVDRDANQFFSGMRYGALRAFNVALNRFGCEQDSPIS